MTIDEAQAIIDKTKTVYTAGVDRMYDGLTLIKKYHDGISYAVGHDQIWCGVGFEKSVSKMSVKDVRAMAEMGWFESEGSWSRFV